MKIRHAFAALAILGMAAFVTADATACGGSKTTTKASSSSCGTKASVKQASNTSSGCTKAAQTGCTSKAQAGKSGCSAECSKACGGSKTAMKACNYTEAQCAKWMRERYESHGWLGIEMNLDGEQPVLTRVVENSPAQAAGFQVDDVLTSVNGISFSKANETALSEMYKNGFKIGDTVVYTANRDGEIVSLTAKLTKITDQALSQMIAMHTSTHTHKAVEKAEKIDS